MNKEDNMADDIRKLTHTAAELDAAVDAVPNKQDAISPAAPIPSECVSPMTGYSKSSSSTPGAISTSDTLNAAIGKLEKRTDLNETNILSEQAKTTGMTEGGSNYITINGIRFYVSSTTPTGTIPVGSIGVGF